MTEKYERDWHDSYHKQTWYKNTETGDIKIITDREFFEKELDDLLE